MLKSFNANNIFNTDELRPARMFQFLVVMKPVAIKKRDSRTTMTFSNLHCVNVEMRGVWCMSMDVIGMGSGMGIKKYLISHSNCLIFDNE